MPSFCSELLTGAECSPKGILSFGRNVYDARAARAQDPPPRDVKIEQRGTQGAADMRAPLCQVHASAREDAPRLARCGEIDVERRQFFLAEPGNAEIPRLSNQPARLQHGLAHPDRGLAGQVVIARPGMQKLNRHRFRRQRTARGARADRDTQRGKAFNRVRNLRAREPEVAMPPLRLLSEQPAIHQLGEMCAR